MLPSISYLVTRPEEGKALSGVGSYIPTLGAATTVIDQYRTYAIGESNLDEYNLALVDIPSVAALAKIAEGNITSYKDLIAAETALQALLLHDYVNVLVHGPKVQFDSNLVTYFRSDFGQRSDFCFQLCSIANSLDWLVSPEFVNQQGGIITESTLATSLLVGKSLDQAKRHLGNIDYWDDSVRDHFIATALDHRLPLYLAGEQVTSRIATGFERSFYNSMKVDWDKAASVVPPRVCSFVLPPLLAIVLDRLVNRQDLLKVVSDLREELTLVSDELFELNKMIDGSADQTELERRSKRLSEAFKGIVPESRMSDQERFKRTVGQIFTVVKAVPKWLALMSGIDIQKTIDITGDPDKLLNSKQVVNKTVTSQTFAQLLKTDSIQAMVKHHFTNAEIAAIERSLKKS